MLNLPSSIITTLAIFAPLFSRPVFASMTKLMVGHILCKGNRTVTNILRQIGLKEDKRYSKYHDVFRHASWSTIKASRQLLLAIVSRWLPSGVPIVIAIDTTLERRRGPRIPGLGRHRDSVRSTKGKKVLTIGHNWLVASVLIRFPGAKSPWSLPFMSVLLKPKIPLTSSRNPADFEPRRHKKMTRYAEQFALQIRRWLGPERDIVLVADSAFCCRSLCRVCRVQRISFCTRLRLDARLFDFPDLMNAKKRGRPRIVGPRQPNLEDRASSSETLWEKLTVAYYGGKSYTLDAISGEALWYGYGEVPEHIRWVLSSQVQILV